MSAESKYDFIIFLTYYHHVFGLPMEQSTTIAEHYRKQINHIKDTLPDNILLYDIALASNSSKLEINFFPLSNNVQQNENFLNLLSSMKKMFAAQSSNIPFNETKDFFNYAE